MRAFRSFATTATLVLGILLPMQALAGTYNGNAAASYAGQYCGADTNDLMVTSGYNRAYNSYNPNDCTNFVSQALYAGGWMEVGSWCWSYSNNWWYAGSGSHPNSNSWQNVASFKQFIEGSGRASGPYAVTASTIPLFLPGDVVLADWGGNGTWDHLYIVVRVESNEIFFAAHTTNRCDFGSAAVRASMPGVILKGYFLYSGY